MVANRRRDGKEEKSNGLALLMAIIIITTPTKILKVKRKSNRKAGRGRISIEIMSKTKNGIPRPDSSIFDRSCRIVDSEALDIKKPFSIQLLKNLLNRGILNSLRH
jgi:hypothetical protein